MTNYCPMPGPVPAAPSNRGYPAGFTAANMLKDLRLSQQAAGSAAAATPMGAAAANLYQLFVDGGKGALDFSAIMQLVRRSGTSG
jgi:3-hydroxyisobutyrate dehydrogenase